MQVRTGQCIFFLLFSIFPSALVSQTIAGSISGTVLEQSGAVVPGARVVATDTEHGVSVSKMTDQAGHFVFPQMIPSTYTLAVEAKGFKKVEQANVVLTANTNISVGNIMLEVGATSETVEVHAEGEQLQADTAERGSTLVGEQLENVEVNGRTAIALLRLTPGVYTDRAFDVNTNELGNIYADGSRGNQQNLTMNGVSDADYGANGRMMATASLDSVQELTILTSNYEAEYGKNAGAQISIVTKGGTNQFHGSGYWYYKDRGMNANSWYNKLTNVSNPAYHFNDPGYTIGGPIYIPGRSNTNRSRLFFFWSEEYERQLLPRDQNGNSTFKLTLPTSLERTGDFSQSVNSNGQPMHLIHDPLSNQPCTAANTAGCFQDGGVLGKIPASRLYAPGIALLNLFPLPNPNLHATGYNYIYQPVGSVPRHEQSLRLDYNLSEKWKLWGSYISNPQDVVSINSSASGYSLSPNFPITNVDFNHPGYLFNVNLVALINSRMTNEAQFGVSHHPVTVLPHKPNALSPTATGITLPTAYSSKAGWIPDFTFNGSQISNSPQLRYSGAGGAYSPFYSANAIIDVTDNFTFNRGSHLLKTGLYLERNRKDQTAFASTEGVYNWGDSTANPLDTGFGFANAAVGVYQSFQQANRTANGQYRYTNLEFYAQDTWKATSRLTLAYGLRGVWAQPWYDKDDQPSTFLPSNWNPSQAPELYWPGVTATGQNVALVGGPNGPVAIDPSTGQPYAKPSVLIGNIVPNTGNITNGILQAGHGVNKYMMQDQGVLLGPRVGITFDLTGHANIIWRAGAGRYFDRYQGNEIFNTITNPPSIYVPTYYNGFATDLNSGSGLTLLGPPSLTVLDYKGHLPTTYKFSTGFQAKLPYSMVLDTSYVGSLARFLLGNLNINPVQYGADFLSQNQDPQKVHANPKAILGSDAYTPNFLRPYTGFGSITKEKFGFTSNYHALQVTVDRRFVNGLFLGTSYTFSKCLDEGSSDGAAMRIDGRDKQANYGNCDFDVRQNLIFNYVYPIPNLRRYGAFNSRALRVVADGWQISGTTQFRTGLPYTPGIGSITVCNPSTSTATSCSSIGQLGLNSNITGTPDFGPRIAVVGNPKAGTSNRAYDRLNPGAFSIPVPGSLGLESRRNYLNTPGVNDFDMSLQKKISLTERAHVELRADAFNVFNHTQFSGVNNTLSFWVMSTITNGKVDSFGNVLPVPTSLATNPNTGKLNLAGFGAVSGSRPARIMQLVTRFVF